MVVYRKYYWLGAKQGVRQFKYYQELFYRQI